MNELSIDQNENNQTLKIANSYVILSEIINVVNFGFRRWVGVAGFVLTILLSLLAISHFLPENPDLNFYLFGLVIFLGTILSLMLFQRTQEITTTGGRRHLQSSYLDVTDEFIARIPEAHRLVYSKKNFLHSWEFVIHINRIVEFSWANRMMAWPFITASILLAAGGLSFAAQIEPMLSMIFFLLGAAFLSFGFLTGRTIITLSGVGGQHTVVYTDREDRDEILEELRNKLEALNRE